MKKLRNLVCVILAMTMLLTSCGSGGRSGGGSAADNVATAGEKSSAADSRSTADAEDIYTVTMTWISIGETPAGLKDVEDKMSAYAMEKIGCKMEFKVVGVTELSNKINLWSASDEKIDLIALLGQDLETVVNQGSIIPIMDYVNEQNTPNIMKTAGEIPFLDDAKLGGILYGVPDIMPAMGQGSALAIRQDVLDALEFDITGRTGFDYANIKLMSYEDLDNVLAQIHEKFPNLITFGQCGALTQSLCGYYIPVEGFSNADYACGVLLDGGQGDTTIVNLYETQAYKEYLDWMNKWQKAGFFSADAATTTDTSQMFMIAGRSATLGITGCAPGNQENLKASSGYDSTWLQVKEPILTAGTYSNLRWGVSCNSKNPEKALALLDLFYADDGVMVNLITNGIEGVNYEVTDYSDMILKYPEGVDGTNNTYGGIPTFYGDRRKIKMFEPNTPDFYENSEAYCDISVGNSSKAIGYVFQTESVQNELGAIQNVLSEYLTMLEYGTCDLESTLPQFQAQLKSAGIDKVIAENQRQFDEFLAGK